MKEDTMTEADARLICEDCIRRTINFHGTIKPENTLAFLGAKETDLGPLKLRIRGRDDPEVGVTSLFYTLSEAMLSDMATGWTVDKLSKRVLDGSIPDMTTRRAMTVIRACVFDVLGQLIPEPSANQMLSQLGINDDAKLNNFKDSMVNSQDFGTRMFKRLIKDIDLTSVTSPTSVGTIIDILRTKSKPAFV